MAAGHSPGQYARRMADIDPFRVVEVLTRARELEAAGRDVLYLALCAALAVFEPATRAERPAGVRG